MNKKSIIGIFCAAGLCGLMLTACGKKDDTSVGNNGNDTSRTGTTNSAANNNNNNSNSAAGNSGSNANSANGVEVHTDGANTVHGDNPGRSRDIDGDGFVEDVIKEGENIVEDAARGVGDVIDDLSPREHDRTTSTTANR